MEGHVLTGGGQGGTVVGDVGEVAVDEEARVVGRVQRRESLPRLYDMSLRSKSMMLGLPIRGLPAGHDLMYRLNKDQAIDWEIPV